MGNKNFVNTVSITKEEFLNVFKTIEKYQKHSDVLNDAIRTVGDGYFMFDAAESLVSTICKLLGIIMDSPEDPNYGNEIEYYIYESPNASITVDEKEYKLDSPEALYDYLYEMRQLSNKEV